ncbi:MAG TPA: PIG-L family deacetylase [Anaerolineales bacterium]|nr:PIG-L family deacetylase [Anaerolineales bacterium]
MHFYRNTAEIFVPDGQDSEQAVRRTTHLAISAHQDDIEIMATEPILQCYQRQDQWFTGVVVSDGRGSPRDGIYKEYTDEAIRQVRLKEQKKAAVIGEYAALVLLDYPSKDIKDSSMHEVIDDLVRILTVARPQMVYTHNLADKHNTHVATALRVISAIRSLPEKERPQKLYGCEVWRDLDWMVDTDKIAFDLSSHENLQAALLGVYDSQISGGKRYDLASLGRRRANATYHESHGVDASGGLTYAMDLTPLVISPELDIITFVQEHIQRFAHDVADRLTRLG